MSSPDEKEEGTVNEDHAAAVVVDIGIAREIGASEN